MPGGTSPTLVLQIQAPQALGTLKELQAAVAALKAGLSQLNGQMSSGTKAGYARLEAEVKELSSALRAARMENENLTKALEAQAARSVAAEARQTDAVKRSSAERTAAKKKSLAEIEAAEEASAARQASREATRNASALARGALRGAATASGTGFITYAPTLPAMAAIAATFAAGSVLKDAVTAGAEFQQQMAFVQVASGESAASIAKVSEEILKLGGDSLFKPTELAQGMRILAQAGLNTKESLESLNPVMALATLGEQTVGKAAETATGLMHAFGLEVKDMPHIVDAIAKSANLSQTNVSEMSEAMRQASTIAKQYNVNIDEMAALMSVLAQVNIRGSAAGTAIMNMFRELDPASQTARRAFKAIGIEVYDAYGKLKPILPLLQEFAQRFSDFDQASQNRLATDYFNNRGAKAFLNAIAESSGALPAFLKEIQQSSDGIGFMKSSLDILGDTAEGQFKKLKGAFETVSIKAFNESGNELKDFLKELTQTISSKEFQDGVTVLLQLATGVARLTFELSKLVALPLKLVIPLLKSLAGANPEDTYGPGTGPYGGPAPTGSRGATGSWPPSAQDVDVNKYFTGAGASDFSPVTGQLRSFRRVDSDEESIKKANVQQIRRDSADQLREIQQADRFELAELELKHRRGLVAEDDYAKRVEQITQNQASKSIDITNDEIASLIEIRNSLAREQDKIAVDTAIIDARAKRDALVREAAHQQALSQIRQQADAQDVRRDTEKVLRKIGVEEEIRRQRERKQIDVPLMPAEVAAAYAAEVDTRTRLATEVRRIDDQIAKHRSDDNGEVVQLLMAEKQAILDKTEAEVEANKRAAISNTEYTRSLEYGTKKAFRDYIDAATNAAEQSRQLFTKAFQGMEDALVKFVMTGKLNFHDFANAVIEDIVRIQIRKTMAGIAGQVGNLNLFGSSSAGTGSTGLGAGDVNGVSSVAVAHSGGILGTDSLASRSARGSIFAGAPRFHSGGLVGHDEVPVIAKHGEGVFTPAQMSRLAPAGSNVNPNAIRVEIHNEGTQQEVASAQPKFDAEGFVIAIVTRDLRNNGPIAQNTQSTFGLNRKAR